jgi:hypothetical protein
MPGYPCVARTLLFQCSSLEEWWGIIQPPQSSSYIGLLEKNPACDQYIIKCSFKGPLRTVLNRYRRGLPPWSLKYPHTTQRSSYPMILCFPLVVLPGLKFKYHTIPFHSLSNSSHFNSIRGKKGPTRK